jgi:RNA polymerase sigma-70 factor (ECF subfamily)
VPESEQFDAFYATHRLYVLRCVANFVSSEDAPDLAQLVWIKVFRGLSTFRSESKPTSWLYGIVRNAACDMSRRRKTKTWSRQEPLDNAYRLADAGLRPDEFAQDQEQRRIVLARLKRLPDIYRESLIAWLSGPTDREAAARLGLHCGTMKTRAHRARKSVMKRISA